jgi:hypothetical protein
MNMKNTIEPSVSVKESEIGVVAYRMWETAGQPAGRDLQFWLDAEAQLRAAAQAASAKRVAPVAPVTSGNSNVHKAARAQPLPSQPSSAKAQQKLRKF